MKAYAVGYLRKVRMGPAIADYLARIDATLVPFGGRYLIHGGPKTVVEGRWPGDLIVIEFPDRASAEGWYGSAAYRQIVRLRRENAEGDVIIIDGVATGHHATDVLKG